MDEVRQINRKRRKNNKLQEEGKGKTSDENKVVALTLLHMQGPLLLYLFSSIASLVVFVSEVSISVYLHRSSITLERVQSSHRSGSSLHFQKPMSITFKVYANRSKQEILPINPCRLATFLLGTCHLGLKNVVVIFRISLGGTKPIIVRRLD